MFLIAGNLRRMKCPSCKTTDKDRFPSENSRKGNLCKQCKADYNVAWYQKNKERHQSMVAVNRKLRLEEVNDFVNWLKSSPCADCRINYPSYVMDFDHLRDKKFSIASSKWKTQETIWAEIQKCEVVCSNCHRERTYRRTLK